MSPDPEDTNGNYVSALDVADGTITITYAGPRANAEISSGPSTLVLNPKVSTDNSVYWICAAAGKTDPGDPDMNGATFAIGSVLAKYTPSECR
jgi:hypothetical protein